MHFGGMIVRHSKEAIWELGGLLTVSKVSVACTAGAMSEETNHGKGEDG